MEKTLQNLPKSS